MATVSWPTSAEIIRQDLRLEFPGQIVLQTEITGHVQVIDRGYGLWRGNCLIGITPEGAEIEGFLSSELCVVRKWDMLQPAPDEQRWNLEFE